MWVACAAQQYVQSTRLAGLFQVVSLFGMALSLVLAG